MADNANLLTTEKLNFLKDVASNLRIDSIRATTEVASGHPTTCMSCAELIAALFFHVMKFDLNSQKEQNNDRFILSKGHATPIVYAAYKQLGVVSDQDLLSLRKFNSVFEGHPTPRFEYNEAATGSLGQGLSIGVGMAINAKHDSLSCQTYVLMGDGEIAEGSVWEAAELASYYKLDNLAGIVDCNRLGQTGGTLHEHDVSRYSEKFKAFGWNAHVVDGHSIEEIVKSISLAEKDSDRPTMIIAKTYKGYGIESVQNTGGYHGKPFKIDDAAAAIAELSKNFSIDDHNKQLKDFKVFRPEKVYGQPQKKDKIAIDLNKDANVNLFKVGEQIATRKAYGYALAALGRVSDDVFALDADVKNSTFSDIFEKEFPDRFIQCFIAEQNMVSVSTGLELRRKVPFAATFGAFFCRAYDQIRMAGIGRNALRLCGSHCGVSIGLDGPSQMALEDIAMMCSIPQSIVLYPSDGVSAYKLVELMANYNNGISYLRTSRPNLPILYGVDEEFEVGGCKILRQSDDDRLCIVAAGVTLHEALKAHEKLAKQGVKVAVIDLYCVKPLDIKTIRSVSEKSGNKILTVEDHYIQGGIGQTIAAEFSSNPISVEIMAVAKLPRSGQPEELMNNSEIDYNCIAKKVLSIV
jgi:transketolase